MYVFCVYIPPMITQLGIVSGQTVSWGSESRYHSVSWGVIQRKKEARPKGN